MYIMQNKKIAVILENKAAVKDPAGRGGPIFASINSAHNCGVIRYTFEGSKYPVGMKVIFGNQKETIMMGEILDIMEESNIIAIIE